MRQVSLKPALPYIILSLAAQIYIANHRLGSPDIVAKAGN